MKKIKCKGIVIEKKEYGDADLSVTVFTDILGKIQLYVKGIRKTKHRDIAAMDVLNSSFMTIIKKNDEYYLSTFELDESFPKIKKDLDKIAVASYLLDVVRKVFHGGESQGKDFTLLLNTLQYLEEQEKRENALLVTAYFLFRIIRDQGIYFQNVEEIFEINKEKNIEMEMEKKILESFINGQVKELVNAVQIEEVKVLNLVHRFEEYINNNLEIKLEIDKIVSDYF